MVLDSWSNWNFDFCGGRKPGPGEKPSWQGREPTNNSMHMKWWEAVRTPPMPQIREELKQMCRVNTNQSIESTASKACYQKLIRGLNTQISHALIIVQVLKVHKSCIAYNNSFILTSVISFCKYASCGWLTTQWAYRLSVQHVIDRTNAWKIMHLLEFNKQQKNIGNIEQVSFVCEKAWNWDGTDDIPLTNNMVWHLYLSHSVSQTRYCNMAHRQWRQGTCDS
jgi:hypothetical protein